MRLVTRGDLDGLTSALLLQEVENLESVELVHPKDVQDGLRTRLRGRPWHVHTHHASLGRVGYRPREGKHVVHARNVRVVLPEDRAAQAVAD